jgi:pilus assembly protein Flp/PilA
MSEFISTLKNFAGDESGVTAIEYGLIAALIGVVIIAGATTLGSKLSQLFSDIGNMLGNIVV